MDTLLTTPDFSFTSALWPGIAHTLKLEHDAYDLHLIRACLASPHRRVVVLAQGHGRTPDIILKHSLSGQTQDAFDIGVAAHRHAISLFDQVGDLHAPALLHVDRAAQVLAMEAVEGKTAQDLLADGTVGRAHVLQTSGAWLGQFHGRTYRRDNPINPDTMLRTLHQLCKEVQSHARPIVGRKDFLIHAASVEQMAEAARGKMTRLAVTHGDMNLRNIIIGPNGTYGIDYGAVHHAPIGHDLARFMADFASFFYPPKNECRNDDWFETDLDAFFSGYDPTARTDPSFHYLLRMQILRDWATIPKDPTKRSAVHRHRWQGIRQLGAFLF